MKPEEYLPPLYRKFASLFAATLSSKLFASPTTFPLPPGPSAHSFWYKTFPATFTPFQFAQWTKQYGPVFSLRRGGDVYIVIGRHQAAVEIMERESASLADRPYFTSAGETLESGVRVHNIHSGSALDKLRRAIHGSFQGDTINVYMHSLLGCAKDLVLGISLEPNEHQKHTRRYATSLIHAIAYAYCTTSSLHLTDLYVRLASQLLERLPTLLRPPRGFWKLGYWGLSDVDNSTNGDAGVGRDKGKGKEVDLKSRLRTMLNAKVDINANVSCGSSSESEGMLQSGHDDGYTYGYGYGYMNLTPPELKKLRKWHAEEGRFHKMLVDWVKENVRNNTAAPCFTTHLLSQQASAPEDGLSDDELACVIGSMFGAGADTIASATSIIIMAAATHPLAQTRVQEELDQVVGRERLPTFDDEGALPMTMAFVLESFRWRPVTVGGYPHRATKDIIWKNYVIPKGAIVIGNHWAIAHDPDVFPRPDEFNPLRWLNKAGQLRDDLKFFNYGFGKRVCPGQDLANRSLFIATALLLWAFRISENPAKKIDTMKFTDSVNMHPEPFVAVFEERGEAGMHMLMSVG